MLVGGTKLFRCSPPRNRLFAVDIFRELSLTAAEPHSGEHPRSVTVGTDPNDWPKRTIRRIPGRVWRTTAREHARKIREILQPGLTPLDHPLNSGIQRQQRLRERQRRQQQQRNESEGKICSVDEPELEDESSSADWKITALDPKNPVYNFLIEYYGLKGTKGVRRLMKWSPGLMGDNDVGQGDVLLEGATEDNFSTSLQTKGAYLWEENDVGERSSDCIDGVVYSPFRFVYGNKTFPRKQNESREIQTFEDGPLGAFLWYRSLLKRTMEAPPVLHCYGLHEWAMQYQPSAADDEKDDGKESPPPPSAKYQSHLKLRIDRRTLNETVESNTIVCTHVDAWKFFAKEALPLNTFYRNADQRAMEQHTSSSSSLLPSLLPAPKDRPALLLRSEQPACVHTTMDLLKIALKLGPFCDAELFRRVLEITIQARSLDVAASPYDAKSDYGVEPIPIETQHGRNEYKRKQMELMKRTEPVRKDLLENYDRFLRLLEQ